MLVSAMFVLSQNVFCQYFSTGIDPVHLKWEQVNQKGFKLLYPENSKDQAMAFSGLLTHGIKSIGASMKHIPRKFPLILHPYSATSNGWTIWAPRRIELFPRPPIIGGAESYADHLLIHEVRHMVQMDKLNTGITKVASNLLGDQAVALVVGLQLPSWLMEGDAVLTETLLSHSGRGRQAVFTEKLRTYWLDDEDCMYDKALFGSYKEFVPNYYVFGYHLTSMGRLLGGPYIWSDAIDDMGKRPYRIANLSRHLKKDIGLNQKELYQKTRSWMTSYWKNQINDLMNPPVMFPVSESDDYVNYIKPLELNSADLILLKKSFRQITEFVRLNKNGNEEHILYPGYVESGSFCLKNNQMVWAERNPDLRWDHRSYSNLYGYDFLTRKKRQITNGKRLFAPDLDSEGSRIVCLEYLPDGTNNLLILDAFSGKEIQRVLPPDQDVFQQPFWDIDGDIWMFTTGKLGKTIFKYDIAENELVKITSIGFKEVFNLVKIGFDLFFIGPSGSTNVLYGLNLKTQELRIVSKDPYGINYLSTGKRGLFASVYRGNGYKPAIIMNEAEGRLIDIVEDLDDPILPLLVRVPGEEALNIQTKPDEYVSKKYKKAFHWFKFHSWAPASFDVSGYRLKPGLMLLSQNELSTMQTTIGAEYNISPGRMEYYTSMKFTAWYPEVSLSARTYHDQDNLNRSSSDTSKVQVDYQYYNIASTISVPLDFSSGRWYRGLISSASFSHNSYTGEIADNNSIYNRSFIALGIGIKGYAYSRMSYRDLFPKYGLIANFTTIGSASYFSGTGNTYLFGSVQAFLPGVLNNHSTRIYMGGFLNNDWIFPDQSPLWLPRGLYSNFTKYNSSLKLDYAFPFLYPDWNLSSVLYVKRLKANVFCDAAKNLQNTHQFFLSAGIDLTSDFFFMRIGAEINGGVRTIYNFTDKELNFEILFDFAIN